MTEISKSMLDEYSLKRLVLGAVIGAAITAFVGFSSLGLMFESKAKEMASAASNAAVVQALAPICAEKFEHAANATRNKSELIKASAVEQTSYIEKGGWAKFPGGNSSNSPAVAEACAKLVISTK